MPKWKRKAFIKDGQLVTLKKLVEFGHSYAFVLPMEYVRFRCPPDSNGNRWVQVNINSDNSSFTIKGYSEEETSHD